MSELTASVVHEVNGKEVIFRELCVAEVRKVFTNESGDTIGNALFDTLRVCDIPLFTSLTSEDIEQLRPSQLRVVVERCKAQNPDFFEMLARFRSDLARP